MKILKRYVIPLYSSFIGLIVFSFAFFSPKNNIQLIHLGLLIALSSVLLNEHNKSEFKNSIIPLIVLGMTFTIYILYFSGYAIGYLSKAV